jgi:hypothetical protein
MAKLFDATLNHLMKIYPADWPVLEKPGMTRVLQNRPGPARLHRFSGMESGLI